MDVTCSECSARYRVPDDRIAGRKVRLPCKRCGRFIIIDHRDPDRPSGPVLPGAARAFREAAPPASSWHVSLASGVEELSVDVIAERCRAGAIFAETYVWRQGMPEWVMLEAAESLRSALLARGVAFRPEEAPRPLAAPEDWEGEATQVRGPAPGSPSPDAASWEGEATQVRGPAPGAPSRADAASWEGEATRVLESKAARAGEDARAAAAQASDDRPSSVPPPLPPETVGPPPLPARRSSDKLTRAEAVAPVRPPRAASPGDDPAGLTVVLSEELAEEIFEDAPAEHEQRSSAPALPRVPPAMAMRPTLPPIYARRYEQARRPASPSALSLVGTAAGIFVLVGVAAVAGYWLSQQAGLGGILVKPASQAAVQAVEGSSRRAGVGDAGAPEPAHSASEPALAAAGADAGSDADGDAAGPFDRTVAEAALASAAASAAVDCRAPNEARGSGRVWLSFLPSGKPVGVSLDGPLSGTQTGLCILRAFFRVSIPPFVGEPVSMGQAVHVR